MADKFDMWKKKDRTPMRVVKANKLKYIEKDGDVVPDIKPIRMKGYEAPLNPEERKEYNKIKRALPKKYSEVFTEYDFKSLHRFTMISPDAPWNKTGDYTSWSDEPLERKVNDITTKIDNTGYFEQMRKTKKAERFSK
jgi:hypothetical protein